MRLNGLYFRSVLLSLITILGLKMGWISAAFSQDNNNVSLPYYTLVPTFALGDIRSEDRGFPVISFLPSRTLLFEVKLGEPVANLGQDYSHAITQDGVKVNISNPLSRRNRNTISKRPLLCGDDAAFPDCNADLLVFSTSYELCRSKSCGPEDGYKLPINPGNIAIVTGADSEFVELEIEVGEAVAAVISTEELARAERDAIVTRVNLSDEKLRHPHFAAEVVSSKLLKTRCGKGASSDPGVSQPISKDEELLIGLFNLGSVDRSATEQGQGIWVPNEFGKPEILWEHRIYSFTSQRETSTVRKFLAQIEYSCYFEGTREKRRKVNRVALIEVSETGEATAEFELNSWMIFPEGADENSSVRKIRASTKDPFLWSTNDDAHYFQLMPILVDELGNRALAGYFYSQFNRSCVSADRKKAFCSNHNFSR